MAAVNTDDSIATTTAAPARAPGPTSLLGLGNARAMATNALVFLPEIQRRYGDVVAFRLFGHQAFLVSNPEGVKQVLQEKHSIYTKENFDYRLLKRVLGEGLVTSEGELWRKQRRLIQPAFHKEKIRGFATIMSREAAASVVRIQQVLREGGRVDVVEEAKRTTLAIVVDALFGVSAGKRAQEIGEAFSRLNELASLQFGNPLSILPFPVTSVGLQLRRAKKRMDVIVDELIEERRVRSEGGDDLLGMLLEARGDADASRAGAEVGMSARQLRDEVTTLMVAGHETTTMLLAWAMSLLGADPQQSRRLQDEARTVLGGRVAEWDDLEDLEVTRRVLEESLRLYPPAWAFSRTPKCDDELGGFRIPRGSTVFLSPWVTHRRADLWPDPERFDPDRFDPELAAVRHRFAHFPFAGGPRLCIGYAFASMEARIILASWAANFRWSGSAETAPTPEALITLRPTPGVFLRMEGASG